jgi:hypothetical protein
MAPPTYIISRVADPIFALFIGLGATATRINREEKEKGKTTQQTVASAKRYVEMMSSMHTWLDFSLLNILTIAY